jgi:hypothetical protein
MRKKDWAIYQAVILLGSTTSSGKLFEVQQNFARITCMSPPLFRKYELMFSKYLYYLSMLQDFSRKISKIATLKPSEMGEQFPNVPSQIITGLLDRFTERSGKKYTLTDSRKTKIMAWQCVLYLTIDGWSTDISKVATDLKMKPPKSVFPHTSFG